MITDLHNDTIRTFNEITGCVSVAESRKILEANSWNLQKAVVAYFSRTTGSIDDVS